MKSRMLIAAAISLCLMRVELIRAQGPNRVRLVFDQAHGEQPPPNQLHAIAKKLGLEVQLSAAPVTATALEGARILYLRAPSQEFTASETEAIVNFVNGGGSLLLVLDEERRQSLEKTRVNDLLGPFGMKLTPDTEYLHNNGGVAKAGEINKADREVPFNGGRAVEGGTAFAFQLNNKEGPGAHSAPRNASTTVAASWFSAKGWRPCFSATPRGSGSQAV
jgi:hypothetical protein